MNTRTVPGPYTRVVHRGYGMRSVLFLATQYEGSGVAAWTERGEALDTTQGFVNADCDADGVPESALIQSF